MRITGEKAILAIKTGIILLGRSTQWMKIPSLTLDDEEVEKIKSN